MEISKQEKLKKNYLLIPKVHYDDIYCSVLKEQGSEEEVSEDSVTQVNCN